ncbi:hypothetical protein AGLY_007038, partial [Aphis glycines]
MGGKVNLIRINTTTIIVTELFQFFHLLSDLSSFFGICNISTGTCLRMCFASSSTNQSGRSSSLNANLFQAASIMSLFIFFEEAIIVPKARPIKYKQIIYLGSLPAGVSTGLSSHSFIVIYFVKPKFSFRSTLVFYISIIKIISLSTSSDESCSDALSSERFVETVEIHQFHVLQLAPNQSTVSTFSSLSWNTFHQFISDLISFRPKTLISLQHSFISFVKRISSFDGFKVQIDSNNNAGNRHILFGHLHPSSRSSAKINENTGFLQKFEFSIQL